MRQAYGAWRRPAPVELYDLESDPYEFCDLASKPEYSQTKDELLGALAHWRQETADPLADPQKFARLLEEDVAARRLAGDHRKPEFQWQYVDYLYSQEG